MEPEEAYQKSLELTEDSIRTYCSWLKGHKFYGDIDAVEMPKFADADYLIFFNGQFDHYVEVKVRFHWWGKYSLEKMPFRKFAVAYAMKELYQRETTYLLRTQNKIGILDLTELPDRVDEMVARHDRGEDKDLYAFYSLRRFRIIDGS